MLVVCIDELVLNIFKNIVHPVEDQEVPVGRKSQKLAEILDVKHQNGGCNRTAKHTIFPAKPQVGLLFPVN